MVILRVRNMTAIDATGLHALEVFSDRLKLIGTSADPVRRAPEQPAKFLRQAEFVEHIGKDNIQPHVEGALAHARRTFEELSLVGRPL